MSSSNEGSKDERCPDCDKPVKYRPVETTGFGDGGGREQARTPYCNNRGCVMYGRPVIPR